MSLRWNTDLKLCVLDQPEERKHTSGRNHYSVPKEIKSSEKIIRIGRNEYRLQRYQWEHNGHANNFANNIEY